MIKEYKYNTLSPLCCDMDGSDKRRPLIKRKGNPNNI